MAARTIAPAQRFIWRGAALLLATAISVTLGALGPARSAQTAFAQAAIEVPADGAAATLPVHVLAHLGRPGDRVDMALRWQNGTELDRPFTLLADADGQGLLIANLDWDTSSQPALPASQAAVLELRDQAGVLLASRQLTLLGSGYPALRTITLYFVADGSRVVPVRRQIAATSRIATATLNELLWGPAPGDPPHLTTALPRPEDVLAYPGRKSNWGSTVKLRGVSIVDGVATANFSREFGAYGGGSLRVGVIDQQITDTLMQFPTVQRVSIAIEGETGGVLQP